MAYNGNFLTSEEDNGYYTQVFDSNYMTDCADWPGKLYDPEAIKAYMPEEPGEKTGVYPDLAATFKADTIEELGKKLGLTDVDAFVKTVARYNELVDAGVDEDMGKPAKWLKPHRGPVLHRQLRRQLLRQPRLSHGLARPFSRPLPYPGLCCWQDARLQVIAA